MQRLKLCLEDKWGLKAPSFARILIWAIGLAFLAGYTASNVLAILYEFKYNNVATKVEIIAMDENFTPPHMVISIPVYKLENKGGDILTHVARHVQNKSTDQCQICQYLEEKSWDVWNEEDIISYFNASTRRYSFYYVLTIAFARRLLRQLDAHAPENIFSRDSYPLNEILFSAAMNYLILQTEADFLLRTPQKLDGIAKLYKEAFPEDAKLDALRHQVLDRICEDRLVVTEKVKNNQFMSGTVANKSCRDLISTDTASAYLDSSAVFIVLPMEAPPKLKEYKFSMTDGSSPWRHGFWRPEVGVREKRVSIFPDIGAIYVSLIDSVYSTHIYQSEIRTGKGLRITASYGVQIRSKDTRWTKSECYNGTSATVCYMKCTKSFMTQKCACVPFSYGSLFDFDANLSYCSMEDYDSCNITEIPNDVEYGCMENCKSACEYTSYNWHVDGERYKVEDERASMEITLQVIPVFNTFAQFLWISKSTEEQLLSQVGGIINLHLGLSGVSIIGFIILCIDYFKRLQSARGKTTASLGRKVSTMTMTETVSFDGSPSAMPVHEDWRLAVMEIKEELRMIRNGVSDELKRFKAEMS